ncbi:hypothetical protein H0H93_012033 [Arthromyces matolae]|nr:hypothetical protein H0H93_012033 [Arthromyces matolae]
MFEFQHTPSVPESLSQFSLESSGPKMDDDGFSITDTPIESVSLSDYEKQLASLQTYRNSLPYATETVEEMHQKLEEIVSKIFIAAKAQDWLVLSSWDGMLQWHVESSSSLLRGLFRLYYELSLIPGVEPRVIRSWTDMMSRLLANKPGSKRKLETSDLQLPWQPLWRAMQKELWPKKRVQDPTRNVVNIFLYVAEECKRYFPEREIPEMLETFLPLLTQDIWEGFNSSVIDHRLLELAGFLSEEHIAGTSGDAGESGAQWKDVGIWTNAEWQILIGKGLNSMNVPVGATQGASTTAAHADTLSNKDSLRIKKSINRSFAKVLVYSMAVDGPIQSAENQNGYVAGSKALDSLDRVITSTESFFHPSNFGLWTGALTAFLNRLAAEFIKRLKEEEQESCRTPVTRRLTPAIRKNFVSILRTPALLAMFSKDPTSASFAQNSLRVLAMLEPGLVMPELLERAYGGLEVVNETHRTTAVLNMLSGVTLPLVSESVWSGGQRHIVPLLELCIPGIDLNDPSKTMCATVFIFSVVQHIKIADLTKSASGITYGPDDTDVAMDNDLDIGEGNDTVIPALSKEESRSLVRDTTASFADWVTSLVRRILALYENLPEEGGRRNITGGKQEEGVLKSIKAMMDVVCLHLSDELFELVLNLLYDYATTNAKSNSVTAFGQLIACMARVRPELTMSKFLPFCISQIEEEIKHGASSIRTTSSHAAIPSDTTLHWNLSILRGCLGFGGTALLKYKQQILRLLVLLVEKTKSERGYTSTGRLITRTLHTLAETYPKNSRFVNSDIWHDPDFNKDHNIHWGRLYNPEDVVIEWHVPNEDEIAFVLEILDSVYIPAIMKLETLLENTATWDSVDRNDFCRAVWGGLSTFIEEQPKEVVNPCLSDAETEDMIVAPLKIRAGFTLTDPNDPRYQKVAAYRLRYGDICERAASALRQNTGGEDHIDAVIGVIRAVDMFMLGYALTRSDFDSLQKNYDQARDANRFWVKQRENSRLVFLKRAQVYQSGRLYMHSLYRRRSALDDRLLSELTELSISPYTRVRRQAQSVLHNVCGYYVRSTRYALPRVFDALAKGNDADRIKGALYILWNKGTAAYALGGSHSRYLLSLLQSQHEEKPSIQQLVTSVAGDCLTHLAEESVHTDAYLLPTPGVDAAIESLIVEFSPSFVDQQLLREVTDKSSVRISRRGAIYDETWRYLQMAAQFLLALLRRDVVTSPEIAKFFMEQTLSPQPSIRLTAQKTYSASREELWFDEWRNPLSHDIEVTNSENFMQGFDQPLDFTGGLYVDKVKTGFLAWTSTIKAYKAVQESSGVNFEAASMPCLNVIRDIIMRPDYFSNLLLLWGQESGKTEGTIELRKENMLFIKSLVKTYEHEGLEDLLLKIDVSFSDPDKFKQRAGAEVLSGILRGSKHWPMPLVEQLWIWAVPRLNKIYTHIKPDTLVLWETFFHVMVFIFRIQVKLSDNQLRELDPRRNKAMIDWILALPLEFSGDSAFVMSKSISIFGILIESLGIFFNSKADQYIELFFQNANTDYAELVWSSAHGAQAGLLFPYVAPLMPEIFLMSELNDNAELQMYSAAVLYVLSAVSPPPEYIPAILSNFALAIKSSQSWRIRLNALPALVVFFYRNLLSISDEGAAQIMDVLLECLSDENVEVREMASRALAGVVRCSQRQSIMPLKTDLRRPVLAQHASDPPPISTTIRKCASEFKKEPLIVSRRNYAWTDLTDEDMADA